MATGDFFHQQVRTVLEKDGWIITDDPLLVDLPKVGYQIDLGAEKLIAAEKNMQKIAVEIKSFLSVSVVSEFHTALGQFLNYQLALKKKGLPHELFIALSDTAYKKLNEIPLIAESLELHGVKMIVFDPQNETIVEWSK